MTIRALAFWVARYTQQLLLWHLRAFTFRFSRTFSRSSCIFLVDRPYGRLGNNIQQVLIAVAHAEVFSGCVSISDSLYRDLCALGVDPEVLPRFLRGSQIPADACILRASFFHYSNYSLSGNCYFSSWRQGVSPRRSSLLSERRLRHLLPGMALQCSRSFTKLVAPSISSDLGATDISEGGALILHLRAGDVADLRKSEYATNPLFYYEWLSRQFRSVVIVTQPGPQHVLLESITGLFDNWRIVRGSQRADFALLANAPFLATSGVGTFPIAAALLSAHLKRLYASDVFLREHLNPLCLQPKGVVRLLRLPGYFRLWKTSADRQALLHQYRPPS